MDEVGDKRRWSAERRLEFIELRAFWDGSLNRGDIRDQFGVSAPQASADIAAYNELAPGNLAYDGSLKCYRSTEAFLPRLVQPSAEAYLRQLEYAPSSFDGAGSGWLGAPPNVATTPILGRAVDAQVLRELLTVMRQGAAVEVLYQSMSPNRPAPQWRRVTPHSLATDGLRWHVRAFCHEASSFKDFLLSRIRETGSLWPAEALGVRDVDWNTLVEVVLVPNPNLSVEQQAAVDWDYQMGGDGALRLEVRRALLYYLRQRLRLNVDDDRPAERPVILADPAAFETEIQRASGAVAPL